MCLPPSKRDAQYKIQNFFHMVKTRGPLEKSLESTDHKICEEDEVFCRDNNLLISN